MKIYYGDLLGRGSLDIVEAYYDEARKVEVPQRRWMAVAAALPFLQEKFTTHEAYGKPMFGQRAGPAREILGSGYWSQDSATQVMAWGD